MVSSVTTKHSYSLCLQFGKKAYNRMKNKFQIGISLAFFTFILGLSSSLIIKSCESKQYKDNIIKLLYTYTELEIISNKSALRIITAKNIEQNTKIYQPSFINAHDIQPLELFLDYLYMIDPQISKQFLTTYTLTKQCKSELQFIYNSTSENSQIGSKKFIV